MESKHIPEHDRPLVTFALFAYNQEKFIREAVEGAFAQTYEPLEIILSDDCSTDRTFEIMHEMAAAYEGPHRIRVNQTPENIGTLFHVVSVVKKMNGQYLIVAAGDDISKPERTESLVGIFQNSDVWAVCSAYDILGSTGEVKKIGVPAPKKSRLERYFRRPSHEDIKIIQGSTAGYASKCFNYDFSNAARILAEDNILNFLIYASGGKVEQIQKSLVFYRQHDDAVHNKETTPTDYPSKEVVSCESANKLIDKNLLFLEISNHFDVIKEIIQINTLKEDIRTAHTIINWPDLSLRGRMVCLLLELVNHKGRNAKWMVARLFGRFPNYQPKMLSTRILTSKK